MHRLAIVMLMLIDRIYEMEGSQQTHAIKVIEENEEKCIVGQQVHIGDKVAFAVQVRFRTNTKRKFLSIALLGNVECVPVTEGSKSITFTIYVDFASGKTIYYRIHACKMHWYHPTSTPFDITIIRGLLQGDTVEIIMIKERVERVAPKGGEGKTSEASNRGDDQCKEVVLKDAGHDDDENAPSSDVSQCGPSDIAAIVIVIVAFLMLLIVIVGISSDEMENRE